MGMLKSNIIIVILYNVLIVLFMVMLEGSGPDPSGQGMIALPMLLMLLTPIHCAAIFLFSIFSRNLETFKKSLLTMLAVVGTNIIGFAVDLAVIVIILKLGVALGIVRYPTGDKQAEKRALIQRNTFYDRKQGTETIPSASAEYDDSVALNNLGIDYVAKGQPDEAIEQFNKALAANPDNGIAYQNRAAVYFNQGKYQQSWDDIHQAEALGVEPNAELLGKLKRASGRER